MISRILPAGPGTVKVPVAPCGIMRPVSTPETSRAESLEELARNEPGNALIRYMLANEYIKTCQYEKSVEILKVYFGMADDEGAGYRLLATALLALGREEEAKETYARGIEAAGRHKHASMVTEFEAALADLS